MAKSCECRRVYRWDVNNADANLCEDIVSSRCSDDGDIKHKSA